MDEQWSDKATRLICETLAWTRENHDGQLFANIREVRWDKRTETVAMSYQTEGVTESFVVTPNELADCCTDGTPSYAAIHGLLLMRAASALLDGEELRKIG